MAEIAGGASVTNERRCKRSDGRGWQCRLPAAEGKSFCERHMKQSILRQKKQPVPEHLKLERAKRTSIVSKSELKSDGGVPNVPPRRGRKRNKEASKDDSDVSAKRAKLIKKEDPVVGASDQPETGAAVVVDLKLAIMEIAPASSPTSSQHKVTKKVKLGDIRTSAGLGRPIRSKNIEPVPIVTKKNLPGLKENLKASANKKIIKRCHWCRLTTFCKLVKCLTCKIHFFCQECINKRFYCKKTVQRECPACQGECSCRACTRGKPKKVETKEPVIYDLEENVIIHDLEKGMTDSNCEKKFDFDKSQQLHMIRSLLPVLAKMNQEKIIELETEAKSKGVSPDELQVQLARYHQKKECSFCKACIPDTHRSCSYCPFKLCITCCHEIRDGYFHSNLENLEKIKMIRSKNSRNTSWRVCLDGSIECPPKHLGGCEGGHLQLTCFYPFNLTKDLEESAKQIVNNLKFKKLTWLPDSSSCLLCDENGESGMYFHTKQEFKDNNLDHFMKHWGKGQPIVVRDVFQSQPDLNWDSGFMLRQYLEQSFESRMRTGNRSVKGYGDWCEIKFGREQIFSGGVAHANVWNEFLKFKLRFSSSFLEDHFPDHYNVVIQSLPVKEYTNPFTGSMNLGAYAPNQTKNPNLGSYVSIFHVGFDNLVNSDLLSNLRLHAYDMVSVLVHATEHPISESVLNEVKMLMSKYNSQDHLKSSRRIAKRNKLEELFDTSARVDDTCHDDVDAKNHEVALSSDESESDDEVSNDVNRCGAHWDVFCREDVAKLSEYLKKYSDMLNRPHGSPKKVVHPLFDEVFYLDDDHKTRLKEEFNVKALSFKQDIGEAVIIPAGCPYQIKKVKSCVNVVYEFMSPESAMEGIKVNDEIRSLPVNHKAKGNILQVKKMAIDRMQAVIEEMREVFIAHTEWFWPFVISHKG